jgi:hypothetical protein
MLISSRDQPLRCTSEERGRIHPVDWHGTIHVGLLGGPSSIFRRVATARSGDDVGQPSTVPPGGGGGACVCIPPRTCIQIVIKSQALFYKHPKSRTSPVPNFSLLLGENFWYWGRSKVVLVFLLQSFPKVKFYNSSPMYIRYTVITPPS